MSTVIQAFKEYFGDSMKLTPDNFCIYNTTKTHLEKLWKWYAKFQEFGISISSKSVLQNDVNLVLVEALKLFCKSSGTLKNVVF